MTEPKLRSSDRTAIYVRSSSQAHTHEAELRAYCEGNGWTVDYDFVDNGISSKAIDRPMFGSMMNFIQAHLIRRIIALKLEHITHDMQSFVEWVAELKEYDCDLILLQEAFDTSTPESQYALSMFEAMAETERNQAKERKMSKRREKARKGGNNGKRTPYGYRFEDGQYIVDDEQAQIVRNVFNNYVLNDISMAKIARDLVAKGVKTANHDVQIAQGKKPSTWQTATVRYILRNGFYAGLTQYEGRETEGEHPAIISVELYRKAQEKAAQTARPKQR